MTQDTNGDQQDGRTRRDVLKQTGAVGTAVASSGCIGILGGSGGGVPAGTGNNSTQGKGVKFPAALSAKQYASAFENVVNMVEAGADPEGNEDVVPVIEQELQSNTLLYFPEGRYKMNSQVARRGEKNLGLIGNGAVLTHGEVNDIKGFTVTEGEFEGKAQHFKIGSGSNPHNGKSRTCANLACTTSAAKDHFGQTPHQGREDPGPKRRHSVWRPDLPENDQRTDHGQRGRRLWSQLGNVRDYNASPDERLPPRAEHVRRRMARQRHLSRRRQQDPSRDS